MAKDVDGDDNEHGWLAAIVIHGPTRHQHSNTSASLHIMVSSWVWSIGGLLTQNNPTVAPVKAVALLAGIPSASMRRMYSRKTGWPRVVEMMDAA